MCQAYTPSLWMPRWTCCGGRRSLRRRYGAGAAATSRQGQRTSSQQAGGDGVPCAAVKDPFSSHACCLPQEELAAELCLLAPARLEHLIPPMPRMMHAVLRALHGSDQSVSVALKVSLQGQQPLRRCGGGV